MTWKECVDNYRKMLGLHPEWEVLKNVRENVCQDQERTKILTHTSTSGVAPTARDSRTSGRTYVRIKNEELNGCRQYKPRTCK